MKLSSHKSRVIEHYNTEPDFYKYSGKHKSYSCGLYEEGATNNDEAAEAKWRWFVKVLEIKEGMSIYEIGFGWGAFGNWLVENYNVDYTGYNLSEVQTKYAKDKYGHDYRTTQPDGKFDLVISDACLVHIPDSKQFFKDAWDRVTKGGKMAHKELHLTPENTITEEGCARLNATFNNSGMYVLLERHLEELKPLKTEVYPLDMKKNYVPVLHGWINGMKDNLEELSKIDEHKLHLDMGTWLLFLKYIAEDCFTCDLMISYESNNT